MRIKRPSLRLLIRSLSILLLIAVGSIWLWPSYTQRLWRPTRFLAVHIDNHSFDAVILELHGVPRDEARQLLFLFSSPFVHQAPGRAEIGPDGQIYPVVPDPDPRRTWRFQWPYFDRGQPLHANSGGGVRDDRLMVPHWLTLAALVGAIALTCLPRRRPLPGHCPHCGYNLTANTSGRCPECGTTCPPTSVGQASLPASPPNEKVGQASVPASRPVDQASLPASPPDRKTDQGSSS
jgi:hypothetical protein